MLASITDELIASILALVIQGYSSYYPPSGTATYRYVRWVARSGYQCSLAELQFHGIILSDSVADTACDASVQVRRAPSMQDLHNLGLWVAKLGLELSILSVAGSW